MIDSDIERFYKALRRLEIGVGGKRLMSACTGEQAWPKSGVYFFFEPGEMREDASESRVVRVGTHGIKRGSKSTLWNRLRTHRGSKDGRGNHRGSVFRLHVGSAISARTPSVKIASWGIGNTADAGVCKTEEHLERQVSAHIGTMSIFWLAIEDEACPYSDRAYIERNLIGLLSKSAPADSPSVGWLGCFSPNERIRNSGLWNIDHLSCAYAPECLDVLEEYVSFTLGEIPRPTHSLAPEGWRAEEN